LSYLLKKQLSEAEVEEKLEYKQVEQLLQADMGKGLWGRHKQMAVPDGKRFLGYLKFIGLMLPSQKTDTGFRD
jgi:hypothetical protein